MNEGFEKITKLREEVDRLKTEEEQAGHQAVRYENKIDNLEKKERTKRKACTAPFPWSRRR